MTTPSSPELPRKRPRSEPSSPASSTSSGEAAFQAALEAEIAAGATVLSAVEAIFEGGVGETGSNAALRKLDLAAPILAAIRATPGLEDDLNSVARMCYAVYQLAEDDIEALRRPRKRLMLELDSFQDVAKMIERAKHVVVLMGAGVSVACGIPDFRSRGGLYESIMKKYGLNDPQAIFDLEEFKLDPRLFYSFAKDVMPSKHLIPSKTHRFVAELEKRGKLLRIYSQNIDGLERRAGVSDQRLILCHGSFLTATCMSTQCGKQVNGSEIADEVAKGVVPVCKDCDGEEGVLKPDIVFFGEKLPRRVGDNLEADVTKADLLLVLGTSLQVAPVAKIPQYFEQHVPRVLVNRELVGYEFDVELLGDCDVVIEELRNALKWSQEEKTEYKNKENVMSFRPPRRFVFAGAAEKYREQESDEESESDSAVKVSTTVVIADESAERETREEKSDD